jgi:hypothetical protein
MSRKNDMALDFFWRCLTTWVNWGWEVPMSYGFGTAVLVREYGGRKLTRRVVKDLGRTVVICNEEEYNRAISEGREPDGIGFPRKDVSTTIEPSSH